MAKKKRKTWLWILVAILILGLAFSSYKYFTKEEEGIEVELTEVELRDIYETVSASGRVFPETEVKISSDVSGEVVELYVMEGDSVKAGQILAKINPDAYVSSVERGQASLNSAKSQYQISEAQIESSKAQIKQIQSQLAAAQKTHDRNTSLLNDGVISQADFEQSLASLDGIKANLESANSALNSSKSSAQGASFNIQSAEATLRELQTSLNRTTIKSPVDGIISNLFVEQGERVVGTIQMTGTEIMRIANLNAMQVKVDVSENDILNVSMNDSVSIEIDAYLDRNFKGEVTQISNSASNISANAMLSNSSGQVTNFEVEIRIDYDSYKALIQKGKPHPFRPGMSASVDIFTDHVKDAITLPIGAIGARLEDAEDNNSPYLEVVFKKSQDTVIQQVVKTGIQDDEYIQILDGIKEGTEVISGPYSAVADKLEEGSQVRLMEENEDKNDRRKR